MNAEKLRRNLKDAKFYEALKTLIAKAHLVDLAKKMPDSIGSSPAVIVKQMSNN